MSTANSPLWQLRQQARSVAHRLKQHVGEMVNPEITVGIMMDDKLIKITIGTDVIRRESEDDLTAMIVSLMQQKSTDHENNNGATTH